MSQPDLDDRAARERGAYREQGECLLRMIDREDPRRLAYASPTWCVAVERMRTTIITEGRVLADDLTEVRAGWPAVRDRELPPLRPAVVLQPAPARPEPTQRSFFEPEAES